MPAHLKPPAADLAPKVLGALLTTLLSMTAQAADPGACRASAQGAPPRVVQLYTSEGCSSCPPADRWLSSLRGRQDVLAAAFHVDYWDRLGWRDRFASPEATARQATVRAAAGARFSYTPQVLVDGRDWQGWPDLPTARPAASKATPVRLDLTRHGDQVSLVVSAAEAGPATLGLWWALLEDGHRSDVRAGENTGAQLHHDHVVRRHGTLAPWRADGAPRTLDLHLPARGEGGRAQRLLVVVEDALAQRTLQAAQLVLGDCPSGVPLR